ncbi:translin-associated protein X isoform X2 [Herrania umbratica]|uniref:Translin-associated protein X isoform X2 n=1 Tax=Herrania umbratica TaxID=108875 RepID=A0A6J1B2X3_9ROSI|nr:translin-associated protein X isoform X2 [Herrania umbratica]
MKIVGKRVRRQRYRWQREQMLNSSAALFRRISVSWLMAPKFKPHRLPPAADASLPLEGSTKRARTVSTHFSIKDAFSTYADYLNALNEKRERVVKASRDVTMNSKKVIFQVHRISKNNREEVLEKAEKDLAAVRDQHISRLVKELQGTDFWKLRRAYSPGLADLTGELMRLAIGRISDGEVEFAERICQFVRDIYRELTLVVPFMDDSSDMKTKMETMLQSVVKIENACFSVRVRGSEYIPLLGTGDPSSFLLGVSEVEL